MSKGIFEDLGDRIQINVRYLKLNTILNCPTFDKHGNEVQPPYKPFTKEDIEKLLDANIDKIFYTKHKNIDTVIYKKDLRDYLDKKVYTGPRSIRVDTQKKAIGIMGLIISKLKKNEKVVFKEAKELVKQIETDINESKTEIINLLDIQSFDDETYSHSLNTGIIAMVFGRKIGLPDNIIRDIGLGGFLHDIGKIRIPYNLLYKKEPLTTIEFNLIKNHARYGYEMLKESRDLSNVVKRIVLLHHEKYDGTGYPFAFKENQIEDYVYIVSVAEMYDALTTKTIYRNSLSHKEAIKTILQSSRHNFKPEIAHQFAHSMVGVLFKESSYYKIGQYVLLNTGEIAQVVQKDSNVTSRPAVEIITNPNGKKLAKPIFINLNIDDTRNIVSLADYSSSEENEKEE